MQAIGCEVSFQPDLKDDVLVGAIAELRPDVLIVSANGPPRLLHNETRSGNHWVMFALEGTKSNRNAYGAKIRLSAGGTVQTDWVRSGSSYLWSTGATSQSISVSDSGDFTVIVKNASGCSAMRAPKQRMAFSNCSACINLIPASYA